MRHFVRMAKLNRRRGSVLPFRFAVGSSLAGATFTRASSATYIDANGVLQTAASGVARDNHYIGGVRSLLLEGQRTNSFLNSGAPATHTSPSLGTGTYTLWLVGTGSIAVAAGTATITGAGTATAAAPVTFTVTVAGTVTFTVTGGPTRAQCENGTFASSYIATAGAAVTRSADALAFATGIGPRAMTVYVKQIDQGTASTAPQRVIQFGTGSIGWGLYSNGPASPTTQYTDGVGNPATSVSAAINAGDTVEYRGIMNPNLSVQIAVAVNGGAEAVSAASAAGAANAAFTGNVFYVGSTNGVTNGFAAVLAVKIATSILTLSQMRSA